MTARTRRKSGAPSADGAAHRRLKTPARRGSVTPRLYEALKRDILSMVLAPGDPLDETVLSERFGLSRTPVREALVRLVAEGLATTLPNRNTVVAPLDFAMLPELLDTLTLMYRLTARLAAQRRSEADLALLRSRQAEFAAAVRNADAMAMIETNRDFHMAIAVAGGNRYYADLFARVLNDGVRLLRLYYRAFEDQLPPEFVAEHDALIAAIADRDARRAEAVGAQHASQIVRQLQDFLAPGIGSALALEAEPARQRRDGKAGG